MVFSKLYILKIVCGTVSSPSAAAIVIPAVAKLKASWSAMTHFAPIPEAFELMSTAYTSSCIAMPESAHLVHPDSAEL